MVQRYVFFVKSRTFAHKNDKTMILATRKEASELYTFFSLLADGSVRYGTREGAGDVPASIAKMMRMEHDGERLYVIEGDDVRVKGEGMDTTFPRKDFGYAAQWILSRMKGQDDEVDISDLEGFLDAVRIYDLEARTDDTTDFHLSLYSKDAPLVGTRIQSRLCGSVLLLDGGRVSNIKYEQGGVRFSGPAVRKINCMGGEDSVADVARRMLYIESHGGTLRYGDVADCVFRGNLLMLDTNLPRIVSSMLMTLHLDGVSRVTELVKMLEEKNPLKMKEELVEKNGFYRHKVRELLLACAWGMRPAKQYKGRLSPVGAQVAVGNDGTMCLYTRADEQPFGDFLFSHSRLEKAAPSDAKYGVLERKNGTYHFKLNLKIGLKW